MPVRPQVRPTPDQMQNLQLNSDTAITTSLLSPAVHFFDRSANSHKRQIHLGRLHMRPIQWHLRDNWKVPESLEKVIPSPMSLHPHLQWWREESSVLQGQSLHNTTCSAYIYRCIKEGCGSRVKHTARGSWSLPENKLHINYLEIKAVFLALMKFQDLCSNKIVFVATDNTPVVSYINKEGDKRRHEVGPTLYPTVECLHQVYQETSDPQEKKNK